MFGKSLPFFVHLSVRVLSKKQPSGGFVGICVDCVKFVHDYIHNIQFKVRAAVIGCFRVSCICDLIGNLIMSQSEISWVHIQVVLVQFSK